MARYRHLPIWKTALGLAVHLEQAVRRFPRYHKYTLGSELRQTAQMICRLVARANEARDAGRVAVLDELVGAVEEMKTLLTLAKEIKAFGHFNDFAAAAELTVSLGKQSGGLAASGAARSPRPMRRGRAPMFTVRPDRPVPGDARTGHEDGRGPTARMGGVPPAVLPAGTKCRGDNPVRPEGAAAAAPQRLTRPTLGTSTLTRATPTPTPTTRTTTTMCAAGQHAARLARQVSEVITRRPGLGRCLELPREWLAEARQRLKRAGIAHVLVVQTGHFRTGFKRRATVLIWRPAPDPQHPLLAPSSRPGDHHES